MEATTSVVNCASSWGSVAKTERGDKLRGLCSGLTALHVQVQPLQARVHLVENCATRQVVVVDVVFRSLEVFVVHDVSHLGLLARCPKAFRSDDNLFTGNVVFFDGFADDDFASALGVDVSCVPGVDALVISCF